MARIRHELVEHGVRRHPAEGTAEIDLHPRVGNQDPSPIIRRARPADHRAGVQAAIGELGDEGSRVHLAVPGDAEPDDGRVPGRRFVRDAFPDRRRDRGAESEYG